jgi:hypothetical protein
LWNHADVGNAVDVGRRGDGDLASWHRRLDSNLRRTRIVVPMQVVRLPTVLARGDKDGAQPITGLVHGRGRMSELWWRQESVRRASLFSGVACKDNARTVAY